MGARKLQWQCFKMIKRLLLTTLFCGINLWVLITPKAAVHVKGGTFVEEEGGSSFGPHGFNYIRLFPGRSHNNFDPEHYDPVTINKVMQRWKSDGFNVVRVFLNATPRLPGAIAKTNQVGLSSAYVARVADFLMCARTNGMAVILCLESFPSIPPYRDSLKPMGKEISPANADYLEPGHIQAKALYLKDLITGLKAVNPECLKAVFSYDLQNEFCYHGSPPFTLTNGAVTVANGCTYQLPSQLQELADDSAIFFINTMAEAIHSRHPGAMVSASVFTYAAVGKRGPGDFSVDKAAWKNRIPFRPMAILRSKADFLDLHFYAADVTRWEKDLNSVEFEQVRQLAATMGKPIIVGEFGVFKKAHPNLAVAAQWMQQMTQGFSHHGFAGWLHWTYDTHEQSNELWHACDGDGAIYNLLKAIRPVPAVPGKGEIDQNPNPKRFNGSKPTTKF